MFPIASFAFVGGLLAGSFLSVIAHRVPQGRSIVGPRSQCPGCGHTIAAYDNIPIISWLVLRGRCRSCRIPISLTYPALELGVALAFAVTAAVLHNDPAELALGLIFVATLAAITITDIERRIIPNRILAVSALIGGVLATILDPSSLPDRAIAAAAGGGFLLTVALIYPRGMGMGDVKLAAVMGLYLGSAVAPALLIGIGAGALVGMTMIGIRGVGARKSLIPFGPFLALGGFVCLIAGNELLRWYLDSFIRG